MLVPNNDDMRKSQQAIPPSGMEIKKKPSEKKKVSAQVPLNEPKNNGSYRGHHK